MEKCNYSIIKKKTLIEHRFRAEYLIDFRYSGIYLFIALQRTGDLPRMSPAFAHK